MQLEEGLLRGTLEVILNLRLLGLKITVSGAPESTAGRLLALLSA